MTETAWWVRQKLEPYREMIVLAHRQGMTAEKITDLHPVMDYLEVCRIIHDNERIG